MNRGDLLAAFLVHGLLLLVLGVRGGGDTESLQGQRLGAEYLVPCLLLMRLGPRGLVLLQLGLSVASVGVLGRALRSLLPGRRGLAGALVLLYLLNVDALRWNCYVLTDGLYLSLSTLLLATLALSSRAADAGFCLVLPLLCLTRPTAPALVVPLLLHVLPPRRPVRTVAVGLALCGLLLMHAAQPPAAPLAQERRQIFLGRFASGRIFNGNQAYNLRVDSPFSPAAPPASYPEALARHPLYSLKYIAVRAVVFLFPAYPHYSLRHRAYQALYYTILYAALLLAAGHGPRRLRLCLAAIIAGTTLLHALTQVDPDARYLAPLSPAFILLLAAGRATIVSWTTHKPPAPASA